MTHTEMALAYKAMLIEDSARTEGETAERYIRSTTADVIDPETNKVDQGATHEMYLGYLQDYRAGQAVLARYTVTTGTRHIVSYTADGQPTFDIPAGTESYALADAGYIATSQAWKPMFFIPKS